ncbi:neprosin family prolyl endopeptidase [Actinoplanes xinjiangensis]|uniref:Uncharacterized protein DUF239 n=1 Tax=Actinoplanes xinjiangensis TaxID=512350 RepID=A0A316EIK0_9ACTN|nr:neprosin family prolyl endopeptidase [Actinoplanes xinjiangensis]PWK29699.1 uncharacterized protein DUF239 [Actinoplanes xinjiangensis]GIF44916.1 hypothetical protein Axi01nite_92270 [Actinoplanes xinjiangensis]
MLKSRRGLLAAGISAVVIGTIGVVSTLNAGAEEIPESPSPAVVAVPAEDAEEAAPESTPPARLPWGQEPEAIEVGRDGASSGALKASGFDAAAPTTTGDQADEAYAPKGFSTPEGVLESEPTDVVPPAPPGVTKKSAPAAKAVFHYNVASQGAVTQGAYANLTINKPALAEEDYHTLAELAVQSITDGVSQTVEVGWTVDRVVNGDADPHLFVFSWVDGKPRCYNGCGFVQYSANVRPGDTLPMDTTKRFGIEFHDQAWWIAYDSEWIGYFPAKEWTVDFSKTTLVQVFGEVASATAKPCTDMGNGQFGTKADGAPARIGSISLISGPAVDTYVRSEPEYAEPADEPYKVDKLSARTFRYGGPGFC